MRVAVCIKQVPDTEARLRVDAEGRWVDEQDLPFVINESDEYALEEALTVAEQTEGDVVVFSLGPDRVREALRKALALGATRAVHLADPAFSGGDALATGLALSRAIEAEGDFDLVIAGSQSDDVGFGSTASIVAEHLGWPHAWLVMGLDIEEGGSSARVVREMESGVNEILRLSLPAVIEVQAGINHPRYASLRGIMQAKKKELKQIGPGDIGLDPGSTGAAGSRVRIVSVAFPASGEGAQMIEGEPDVAARELVEKLRKEARVL